MAFAFECPACAFGETTATTTPTLPGPSSYPSKGPCQSGYTLRNAGTAKSECVRGVTVPPAPQCPAGQIQTWSDATGWSCIPLPSTWTPGTTLTPTIKQSPMAAIGGMLGLSPSNTTYLLIGLGVLALLLVFPKKGS